MSREWVSEFHTATCLFTILLCSCKHINSNFVLQHQKWNIRLAWDWQINVWQNIFLQETPFFYVFFITDHHFIIQTCWNLKILAGVHIMLALSFQVWILNKATQDLCFKEIPPHMHTALWSVPKSINGFEISILMWVVLVAQLWVVSLNV